MSEPRRAEFSATPAVDQASQADALLVQGLDQYFLGRFEDAIHIWTRVLFLDRSHPRARAYIDRARSAIAERQRRSDEMLQATQQLLDRGDAVAARALLREAVAAGGEDERAAALRLKLERVELAVAASPSGRLAIEAAPDVVPAWEWPRRVGRGRIALAALAGAVGLYIAIGSGVGPRWFAETGDTRDLAPPANAARLPVLSSSDVAIIRARTLYGRGRLAEALQALDRVDDHSPVRVEADALRIEIQRLLLASGGERRQP